MLKRTGAIFKILCASAFLLFAAGELSAVPEIHRAHTYFLPQAPDSAKVGTLKKKLQAALKVLKFRQKARDREKDRIRNQIQAVIDSVPLVKQKQLEELLMSMKLSDSIIESEVDGIKNFPGGAKPNGTAPVDKDLMALLAKLSKPPPPAPFVPVPVQVDNKKLLQLKRLRSLYSKPVVITDTISKDSAVLYRLRIKRIAEVWGFHKYDTQALDYNFTVLSNLVFQGYTMNSFGACSLPGNFSGGWEDAAVLTHARDAGCHITLSVSAGGAKNILAFLGNAEAQKNFAKQTLQLLDARGADGINLDFKGLQPTQKAAFTKFIELLAAAYRARGNGYKISISIPGYDKEGTYDLSRLDLLTDYFLIDFSSRQNTVPGPIAPLNEQSDLNIASCVSRYLNSGLDSRKFILCLPYHGIKWTYDKKGNFSKPSFPDYKTIRQDSDYQFSLWDEASSTNLIELKDTAQTLLSRTWFDDDYSLGKKYDYIVNSGLSGTAIRYLSEGEGYGELWDELAYKFLAVDSIALDSIALKTKTMPLTWWQQIKYTLNDYYYVLENPCDPLHDRVDTGLITWINIILAVLCLASGVFCIYGIRRYGNAWKYKKAGIIVLIILVSLLVICAFIWVYLNGDIPWFGVDANCIDMPFRVLFGIIVTGVILGILITRYLIFPVIQKEDTP